jgi:hypothetical protein
MIFDSAQFNGDVPQLIVVFVVPDDAIPGVVLVRLFCDISIAEIQIRTDEKKVRNEEKKRKPSPVFRQLDNGMLLTFHLPVIARKL